MKKLKIIAKNEKYEQEMIAKTNVLETCEKVLKTARNRCENN